MLTRPDKAAGAVTVTKFKNGKVVSEKIVQPHEARKAWLPYGRKEKKEVEDVVVR